MAANAIKVVVRVRPPSQSEVLDAEHRGQTFTGTLEITGDDQVGWFVLVIRLVNWLVGWLVGWLVALRDTGSSEIAVGSTMKQ